MNNILKKFLIKKRLSKRSIAFLMMLVPFYASSQAKLDSLLNSLNLVKDDSSRIELKIKISKEYHQTDVHDKDIPLASDAVEYALQLNNTYLYAKALNNLGLLYRYHQQYAEAVSLHTKAFDITEFKNIPPLQKMIFANNAGVASRYNSDYTTAINYYLKALRIAEKENDLKNIEIACNGLGNTLIAIPNREDEALSYLERALEIATVNNNKLGIAMNYLTISDYYNGKGKFTVSRQYLDNLLRLNLELKDKFGIAMTYQYIGHSFLDENKDLSTAKAYFNKSLRFFTELKDNLKQADLRYNIAIVLFKEGNMLESLGSFKESLSLATGLNNKRLIMKNAEMISQIYEELADDKKALDYYKISQRYKDSINLYEQTTEVAAINNRYNFEKKEAEIEILKKDKSIQESQLAVNQAKLRNRSLIIFLMSLSLFSFILLVSLQRRNRRARLMTEKKLQLQEKEKLTAVYEKNLLEAEMLATRMQVHPHFLFNCLNSIKYMIQSDQNEKAIQYLVIFSRFVRMVLETSNSSLSTICEELELIKYYLKLEEGRFNDDFSFSIQNNAHDKHLTEIMIPTLLLQPFVENSIWHGLLPSKKTKKEVIVKIDSYEDRVQITIDDNGVGRKKSKVNTGHRSMGHKITKDRIELFNRNYSHTIDLDIVDKTHADGSPAGTCVILILKNRKETLEPQFLKYKQIN